MRITRRLRRSFGAAATALIALILALLIAAPASAQFAGSGGTTGITLSVASWVPARDKSYGGWGVARAGESIAKPLMWTNTAPSLTLPAGSYDVYWVQDFDTRDKPVLIAAGVRVAGGLTTVPVDSGLKLATAAWVPKRDKDYGWWGAVKAGAAQPRTADLINWSKSADALVLPPGAYDVYWVQDFDNRDRPMRIAEGVTVSAGQAATVAADAGVRVQVAAWVPKRDNDYGWWGAVKAGAQARTADLVNFSRTADALLLAPGKYDIYWVQDFDTRDHPMQLASGLTIGAGAVATVAADSGVRLQVASWVPKRDKDYGWWGAAKAGTAQPRTADLVNWSKSADALLLPPGQYDAYWVQDFETRDRPLLLAAGLNVAAGMTLPVSAASGLSITVDAAVPALDKDTGWWGASLVRAGADKRINWVKGPDGRALLLPPGKYDIYWRINNRTDPQLKARGVEIKPAELASLRIGVPNIPDIPSVITRFQIATAGGPALPAGAVQVDARYEWAKADIGRKLGVRWFKDDQMVLEQGEPVAAAAGATSWSLKMADGSPLPAGRYRVEVTDNGEAITPLEFTIGQLAALTPPAAGAAGTGPATPPTGPAPGAGTGAVFVLLSIVTSGPADLSDDFANPASGWTVNDRGNRHQAYEQNAYTITLDAADSFVFGTNGKQVANGIIQVDARDDASSAGHPFGIFVRAQDEQNYHAFVVATDNSFAAFHVQAGQFAMDGKPDQQLPKDLLVRNGPNRIQVFMDGSNIVYFLNGREIDRATALWPTGLAGVLSAGGNAPGKTKVAFDDWKVWSAGPAAATAGAPTPPASNAPAGAAGTPGKAVQR
jgi:hypothetical protein